jgi:hypothetical protein
MRCGLLLSLLASLFLSPGCATRKADSPGPTPESNSVEKPTKASSRKAADAPAVPYVVPARASQGVVASVNLQLRFVVLNYGFAAVPAIDQRLNVYRAGQKVAELRITGPARDNHIVADILAGEVQIGDEARPE